MTDIDWLVCSGPDLAGELSLVRQAEKLFLLGAGCLRRVWDQIPTESVREAVEITERFARGRATLDELLAGWSQAEHDALDGSWLVSSLRERLYSWCPCCQDEILNVDFGRIHPGVRELMDDPAEFASRAAEYAWTLVRDNVSRKRQEEAEVAVRRLQFVLYRDLVGDPEEPSGLGFAGRRNPAVQQLLRAIDRVGPRDPLIRFALADTLEEAGCQRRDILDHLRQPGPHFPGCWAVEAIRGRPAPRA